MDKDKVKGQICNIYIYNRFSRTDEASKQITRPIRRPPPQGLGEAFVELPLVAADLHLGGEALHAAINLGKIVQAMNVQNPKLQIAGAKIGFFPVEH